LQDLLTVKSGITLDELHLWVLFLQVGIAVLVGIVLLFSIIRPFFKMGKSEWVLLELIWTVFPALILICLGIPRLELLYKFEGIFLKPDLLVKVVAHQWFWEYNLREFGVRFDSFTEKNKIFRLAEVSEKLVLPFNTKIQLLITRHDVIHSFALPNLAIKSDANPGRLNLANLTCHYPRLQVGQCRELCGVLHSNIRIVVEFTSVSLFKEWLRSKI